MRQEPATQSLSGLVGGGEVGTGTHHESEPEPNTRTAAITQDRPTACKGLRRRGACRACSACGSAARPRSAGFFLSTHPVMAGERRDGGGRRQRRIVADRDRRPRRDRRVRWLGSVPGGGAELSGRALPRGLPLPTGRVPDGVHLLCDGHDGPEGQPHVRGDHRAAGARAAASQHPEHRVHGGCVRATSGGWAPGAGVGSAPTPMVFFGGGDTFGRHSRGLVAEPPAQRQGRQRCAGRRVCVCGDEAFACQVGMGVDGPGWVQHRWQHG